MEIRPSLMKPGTLTPQSGADKLRDQAKQFEGVFINMLMKEMFASIKTDSSAFGGGFAEETWRGMQAEQYASSMAEAGGIGLADAITSDLLKLQEAAQSPANTGSYPS